MISVNATLLTKRWYDERGKLVLEFWVRLADGVGRIVVDNQPAVFFVERYIDTRSGVRKPRDLLSMARQAVDAVYFSSQASLVAERQRLGAEGYLPLEADIRPCDRYLMERFITGDMVIEGAAERRDGYLEWRNPRLTTGAVSIPLKVLSFDIETVGLTGPVISIAGVCGDEAQVFVHTEAKDPAFTTCRDELATIVAFERWLRDIDPDVLIGWNVIDFDLRVLIARAQTHGVELALGRGNARTTLRKSRGRGGTLASVTGRVVLDGGPTLRASGYFSSSYALEHVSQELLGTGKTIAPQVEDKAAEIQRLHAESPAELAAYNKQDCALVRDIFVKQDLLGYVLERQRLTGLALDRQGGSVAAFDYLYLPRLHRKGFVAPTINSKQRGEMSPGGYVLKGEPGLFKNVLVFDFKSLYPSIIRTFLVDPLGMVMAKEAQTPVAGFRGASFHRDAHILPGLLTELWHARDEAKQRKDSARSYAIKILMNSFYGVLGTTGCRFFDPRLASSITLRGHEVIMGSKALMEAWGHEVVYGDTDSLFVRVGDALSPQSCAEVGRRIALDINTFWRKQFEEEHGIESFMELQFETHFLQLYMPTKRGSSEGSKKRYAGWVQTADGHQAVIKGLEAVRTDWTPMARSFQRELLRRVFSLQLDDLCDWLQTMTDDVRAGRRDSELVYTKRMRRAPDEYTKNIPPHVRAALILGGTPRKISYVVTTKGPQPVTMQTAGLDYDHYLTNQLLPAGEGILKMVGIDLKEFTSAQMQLL